MQLQVYHIHVPRLFVETVKRQIKISIDVATTIAHGSVPSQCQIKKRWFLHIIKKSNAHFNVIQIISIDERSTTIQVFYHMKLYMHRKASKVTKYTNKF